MLYKETPFTGYCIALVTGIICSPYLQAVIYCYAAFTILSVFLALNIIIYPCVRSSVTYGLTLHFCIFFLGCILPALPSNKLDFITAGPHEFVIRTDDYPEPASRSLMLHGSIITIGGDNKYADNKLILYTDKRYIPEYLKPGSILSFVSTPVEISDFDNSDSFDYKAYMNRRGFRYCTFCYDSIPVIGEKAGLKHLALKLRKHLLNRLANTLNDDKSLAIVSAMTLGYRELIDDEIKEEFRKSGIIHIMAVSGLHVGIVSLIVVSLLKITRIRSGTARVLISLIVIWSYALITGLSPSVTRASLMFSFLNTGYLINRPVKPLNSVMASAFLILVIKPDIIYEPSFLLSYSAVIVIVSNYKDLVTKFNFRGRILRSLWKMLAISLLAQAGTLPFVALFFGEIPLLSIISNLFAIPLATIILSAGIILIITAGLPLITGILNSVLAYCVNTLSDAASTIASLDMVVTTADELSVVRTVILFALSMALIRFFLDREKNNPHIPLALIILFFIMP